MKSFRPTTPSRRQAKAVRYKGVLTAVRPHKALTRGLTRASGHNSKGRITTRHHGGGHKRSYRDVDFLYDKKDIPATIETVEYDPNRSAFIALALYRDGERRYVLVPQALAPGSTFVVSEKAPIERGNRTILANLPVGAFVYNIELHPGGGAKIARSAGIHAEVIGRDLGFSFIKMPSGEVRKIKETAWASIGEVSNPEYHLRNLGKAGRSRWLGVRPTVRGSAMNPVDHPHGGGEGRQGIGLRRVKNVYGKAVGGIKTRRAKKYSNNLIVNRRKSAREKRR